MTKEQKDNLCAGCKSDSFGNDIRKSIIVLWAMVLISFVGYKCIKYFNTKPVFQRCYIDDTMDIKKFDVMAEYKYGRDRDLGLGFVTFDDAETFLHRVCLNNKLIPELQ